MTLQIHTRGSGPDLVLLHGWGMIAAVWRALCAELARDFRVHAVEMPGYGISVEPACDTLATLLEKLADAMPVRATVCGWSLGGQIAMTWAQARPAQVERLILLATTPRFACGDDWTFGMTEATFEDFARDAAQDPPRTLRRFLAFQAEGDTDARTILRRLREANTDCGEPGKDAQTVGLRLLREIDLRPDLAQIRQPALVIHGVNDGVIPHAAGEFLARTLAHAEFESVTGAAHAVFVTREAMIAQRIRKFHGSS